MRGFVMKKINVFLGLLCMVMILGCNKNTGTSRAEGDTQQTMVEWWSPNWDETVSRELIREFEAENPNIRVNLVITDWDTYKSKITAAITTKNAPQLYTILLTDVVPFAELGVLEPLDDLMVKNGMNLSDILSAARQIVTVDNNLYQIPFRYDGSGIYYNVDLLSAAGYDSFPTTWEEMIVMSKKLTKDGHYGFAWPLGNQANAVTRFVQQLYTYGGDILSADEKKCLLDSDAARKALANVVNSVVEGYASPSSLEIDNTKMRDMFGSGQIAFNFTGPFDVATLKADYPNLNFKTAHIPGVNGMGVTTANGWGLVMAQNTTNKEAAAQFLSFVGKPENQARLTASFPASYVAMQFPQFATAELIPFSEQLENSRPEPAFARWAEIEPILFGYIQQAVSNRISIPDAITGMARDVNSLILD
jgi:ABC-type glycerol-3-phosphate transport system substrate-binding protein